MAIGLTKDADWRLKKDVIAEERQKQREDEERKKKEEEERKKRAEEEKRKKEEEARLKEEERKALEEQKKREAAEKARKNNEEAAKAKAKEESEKMQKQNASTQKRGAFQGYDDGDDSNFSAKEKYSAARNQLDYWDSNIKYSQDVGKGEKIATKEAGEDEFKPIPQLEADEDVNDYVKKLNEREKNDKIEKSTQQILNDNAKIRAGLDAQPSTYDAEAQKERTDEAIAKATDYANRSKGFAGDEDTQNFNDMYNNGEHYSMPSVEEDNVSQIENWLNPNYKLSKDEEAQAKQLINDYELQSAQNPGAILTDEQKQYEQSVYALKDKVSNAEGILQGLKKSIPFLNLLDTAIEKRNQGIENQVAEEEGREAVDVNKYGASNRLANAETQNPLAVLLGQVGAQMVGTNVVGGALANTQYGNALSNLVGKAIPNNQLAADIVTGTLMDAPVDLLTDTLPQLTNDIANGMDGKDVAKDMLSNVGLNLGVNFLTNGVLDNVDGIKNLFKKNGVEGVADVADDVKASQIENAVEQIAKQTDDTNSLPKSIIEEANANNQLAKDYENLYKQIDIDNQANLRANRIAEEATANANDDMAILKKAIEENGGIPSDVDNVANKVDDVTEATKNTTIPTEAEVKEAKGRLYTSDRNAVTSIEDDIANGFANEEGYAKYKAEKIARKYFSDQTGKYPEDIDLSSDWNQMTVKQFEDDINTIIKSNNSANEIPKLVDDATNITTGDAFYDAVMEVENAQVADNKLKQLSKADIDARDVNTPLNADELGYYSQNDGSMKTINVNGKRMGTNLSSTINTYGSKDMINQTHNAYDYLDQYAKTGEKAYLDRANDIVADIENNLEGSYYYRGSGKHRTKVDYTPGSFTSKWDVIVDEVDKPYKVDRFLANASDSAKSSYERLAEVLDEEDLQDYVVHLEKAIENPSVDSFDYASIRLNKLADKVKNEYGLVENIDELKGAETNLRDDVKNLFRDMMNQYNANTGKATEKVAKNTDNVAKNVNILASEGNMTDDIARNVTNPYKTSNADVNSSYADDLDLGSNPKQIYDERGLKSEVLNDGTEMKRSQTYDNTLMNQKGVTGEEKEAYNPENYMYAVNKRADSVEMAHNNVQNNIKGMEDTYFKQTDKKTLKKAGENDADNLFAMQKSYLEKQRAAKEAGDQQVVDIMQRKIDQATKAIQQRATESAQFLRALCDYSDDADGAIIATKAINDRFYAKKMFEPRVAKGAENAAEMLTNKITDFLTDNVGDITPNEVEDMMIASSKAFNGTFKNNMKQLDVESLANQLSDAINNGESYDDIIEEYKKLGVTGFHSVSDATKNQVADLFEKAKQYDYNSEKYMKYEEEAYSLLANELNITSSFADKVAAWRYFSMLANPKTHLRNIAGNTLFGAVTEIKDNFAALLEVGVDKALSVTGDGIERTKSILNPLKESDNALINASKKNSKEVSRLLKDGNKYYSADSGILSNISTFKNKGVGKVGNALVDGNTNLLDLEDTVALENKYANSLARYLKANGADASIFSAEDEAAKELLEKAQNYAINEAKYATFHNDNSFATGMSKLRNTFRDSGTIGGTIGQLAMDSLVPFAKTPSNVVSAIAAYSPINSIKVLADIKGLSKGTKKASDVIDDIAKTATGTGLFGLGYVLAKNGVITSNKEKDEETGKLGGQSYAWNTENGSYTIDNFAPVSAIMLAGAALAQESGNDDETSNTILNALASSFNPVIETSMMQNFADILTSASYADTNNPVEVFGKVASQTATGYATQFIPTEIGNIARGIDNTRYSTYSDKEGISGVYDRTVNSILNKSGVNSVLAELVDSDDEKTSQFAKDNMNYPYVDAWGNEAENYDGAGSDSVVGRMAYQNLSPGYYKKNDATELDYKLNELGLSNDGVKTSKQSWTNKDGEQVNRKLTPEEYYNYGKEAGAIKDEALSSLFDNATFDGMDEATKKEIAKSVLNFSNSVALSKAIGDDTSISSGDYSKDYDIYKKYGAEGYVNKKIADSISKAYAGDKSRNYKTDALGILESDMSDKQKLDMLKENDEKFGDMTLDQANLYYRFVVDMDADDKYGISQKIFDADASDDDKLALLYRSDYKNTDTIKSLYDYGGIDYVDSWYDFKNDGGSKLYDADTEEGKIPYLNDSDLTDSEKGYLLYSTGTQSNGALEKVKDNDYSGFWEFYYKKYMGK